MPVAVRPALRPMEAGVRRTLAAAALTGLLLAGTLPFQSARATPRCRPTSS